MSETLKAGTPVVVVVKSETGALLKAYRGVVSSAAGDVVRILPSPRPGKKELTQSDQLPGTVSRDSVRRA